MPPGAESLRLLVVLCHLMFAVMYLGCRSGAEQGTFWGRGDSVIRLQIQSRGAPGPERHWGFGWLLSRALLGGRADGAAFSFGRPSCGGWEAEAKWQWGLEDRALQRPRARALLKAATQPGIPDGAAAVGPLGWSLNGRIDLFSPI